jgi:hypothetical protein
VHNQPVIDGFIDGYRSLDEPFQSSALLPYLGNQKPNLLLHQRSLSH